MHRLIDTPESKIRVNTSTTSQAAVSARQPNSRPAVNYVLHIAAAFVELTQIWSSSINKNITSLITAVALLCLEIFCCFNFLWIRHAFLMKSLVMDLFFGAPRPAKILRSRFDHEGVEWSGVELVELQSLPQEAKSYLLFIYISSYTSTATLIKNRSKIRGSLPEMGLSLDYP
jgi:hypothetical protein